MDGDKVKNIDKLKDVDFQVKWEGQPAGLWARFLSKIHLNFTYYQITKDELIIKTGFFKQKTNTTELYQLKDADMEINLWQRLLKIGTIKVLVDTHANNKQTNPKEYIEIKNIKDCARVRKLLRDAIEADVMERRIAYFDRV